jgi:deoxycitidine kinase/deoxyguanosine kinase|tara:strand:+ start:4542 stop:5246 length:705 start_codon:yes stop_codon:yes gene_type:complete
MVVIFSVEGNIGSGKSTLVKYLSKNMRSWFPNNSIIFLQEPVDEWNTIMDENGITILENFYKDQEKYAFSFQMMAYISRLSLLKKTIRSNPNSIIICERSMWTDKEVFAKMLFNDNKIDCINYTIYNKWFDEFVKDVPLTGIIYVKTNPRVCQERIKIRGREGETIPLEYSVKCHNYHEEWFAKSSVDIIELDGDVDFKENIPDRWKGIIYNVISSNAPPQTDLYMNWNDMGYY